MSKRSRVQRKPVPAAPAMQTERPDRLRTLLFILACTTVLLVAHQLWRLNGGVARSFKNDASPAPAAARAPAAVVGADAGVGAPAAAAATSAVGAPVAAAAVGAPVAAVGAPAAAVGTPAPAYPDEDSEDDLLEVQFDEDGEIDLGTMQRMLDILYRQR
ncbi:hypothetical protein MCUN1_001856 [Malassezia cuniculi]|uniref:Uncharacterized protein n=1 Tax=Malassezia cuniculi TaxID=948313 RepID=A0AAF0J6G0_9BASI|nr:hypothetical protein MCUN1_001856 [Malassezia cuniculi]